MCVVIKIWVGECIPIAILVRMVNKICHQKEESGKGKRSKI